MAIATLSSCYNNPMVFQGVVKIRKGQAVTLMMEATNMRAVQTIIAQYSQEVSAMLVSDLTQRQQKHYKTEQKENVDICRSQDQQTKKVCRCFFPVGADTQMMFPRQGHVM